MKPEPKIFIDGFEQIDLTKKLRSKEELLLDAILYQFKKANPFGYASISKVKMENMIINIKQLLKDK